ncbi:uncharacterized protein [Oscarella lobularis]|uniref:uncharacterized protein n=1 Tax=Oscarella lobularis TaxID=121494 RepID=UPI0033132B56
MASDVRLCARSDSFTSFSITGAKATLYHHERRDENDEKATLYDFLAKTPRRRARVEPKTSTSLPPLVRRRMTSSVAAAKPKRARKTHRKAKHVRESISVSNVEAFAAKAPQRRRRDVNVTLRNAFSMLEVAPAPQQSKSSSTREKAGSCRVKIYQSERQSEMMIGIPAAPPATPTPDHLLRFEYVSCLSDIRSQRLVKARLNRLEQRAAEVEQRKEEALRLSLKRHELKSKAAQKMQQRAEIYALNRVMTELEQANFDEYSSSKNA